MSFETQLLEQDGETRIILKDKNTGTFAEIYAFGALLNNFSFAYDGGTINVIDGFTSVHEAKLKLTPFFQSAKLSPFVCRIKDAAYYFGGMAHKLTKYTSKDNALHGLLFDLVFDVREHSANEHAASATLEYNYAGSDEGYPFKYSCAVTYTLGGNNALTVTTKLTNTDEQLIPVADGWHPYFKLGGSINDYLLEFQSREMLEFDEALIPTGRLLPYQEFGSLKQLGDQFFDNCFTLDLQECQPLCVIRNPATGVQLEIHPDQSYPYLQLYTPDHRQSIAIENLSAAPDAFNNGIGLMVLEPGQEAAFTTTFIAKSL